MTVWCGAVLIMACVSLSAGKGQNIALNKPAWMSTSWQNRSASKAVDGVINTKNWRMSAHTDVYQPSAWWKVDLQTEVRSPQVIIYFRSDFKVRRNGVQFYTSVTNSSDPKEGDLCYTVRGQQNGADIPDVLNVTCPGAWRYLTVYTETGNDKHGPILDFAEIQVWKENIETSDDGQETLSQATTWIVLTPSFTPLPTEHECGAGKWYGTNCMKSCAERQCKHVSGCDVIQGRCDGGCMAGWYGTDCTQECFQGLEYGANCVGNCNTRMCEGGSVSCPRDTGRCELGCQSGWTGEDCIKELRTCTPSPNNISVLDIIVGIMVGVLLVLVLGLYLRSLKNGKLHWNCRPVQGQQIIDVPKFADVHATKDSNNVNIIEDIL
ncbi:uncharacterized protein LOC124126417 [Haliotis rufescens]|uniref:uncharacterized protein LOC124126417 n=1 Tax=Haliotis rufescens TaxID=6454 RepID=UPI00201ED32C|nr:uncharacterized protein LOC124126417 [Haliotis rufescens]